MKRKIYLFLCILSCITFLAACSKDDTTASPSDSQEESTQAVSEPLEAEEDTEDISIPDEEIINPDAEDEPGDENLDSDGNPTDLVPIEDAGDDDEDDAETEQNNQSETTDVQNKVSENPTEEFNGSGTFNGFVDSSSVEITMSDGSYQTFFVYDENVLARLQNLEESGSSSSIQFTYRGIDGQVNPEIISIQ